MSDRTGIIRIVCRDEPGLVAKVSGLLFQNGCNVFEDRVFVNRTLVFE